MMYLGDQAVGLATSLPEFADIAKIECGSYTPSVDELTSTVQMSHSLGEIPDFICYWCDNFPASDQYTNKYDVAGGSYITMLSSFSSLPGIRIVTITQINNINPTVAFALKSPETYATISNFVLPYANKDNDYLKANVTYHYIIGKFKEVTPNA